MRKSMTYLRSVLLAALMVACVVPLGAVAGSLPSGERIHGNTAVEPAYDDMTGGLVYLSTPGHLAPLGPTNVIQKVNYHAVAPLYLIVYPAGTPGIFNCMGVPGNCPDHDGAIAGLAAATVPSVYPDPNAIPGHDHLVGVAKTGGDYNSAWRVMVELFTSTAAVHHITTLSDLQAAQAASQIQEVNTGIVFLCSVVSESAYMAGAPAA